MFMQNSIFKDRAIEIDKWLRENGIKKARKRDLIGRFDIRTSNRASSIWWAMSTLGWRETWSYLERD